MVAPAATATGRRFGVELEIAGLSCFAVQQALTTAGIRCANDGYNHRTLSTWKVVTDASVVNGCEVVSPPMRGEAGLAELKKVCTVIREAGGSVNPSCGMHVHVDMDGLTGEQIAQFIEAYAGRQATIDRMVAPSRRSTGTNARWCRPLAGGELSAVTAGFRANRTAVYVDRYRTVNVMSFPRYGTVEIRQHQGTVSGRKAGAWVRMLLGLVEAVENNSAAALSTGAGMLGDLADATTIFRTQDAAFLGARMEELAR